MSQRGKNKISTSGSASLDTNPFGNLNLGDLPAAPKPDLAQSDKKRGSGKKLQSKGRVEIRREKAGRGGKTVTTLKAFQSNIPLGELEKMTLDLKKSCACGGTLKGREIELQGDVCDRVMQLLESRGYKPVRCGG